MFSQKSTSRAGQVHRIFFRVGALPLTLVAADPAGRPLPRSCGAVQYKVQHRLVSKKFAASLDRELIRLDIYR